MRRLPIFILIDTSGSMRGEPIAAVQSGLQSLLSSLNQDPYALETVYLSLITFDFAAREIIPLTEISAFKLPELSVPNSAPTNLGHALELLCDLYDRNVQRSTEDVKGDWLPLAVVMTDGAPSDTMRFDNMCQRIKTYSFARIVACAAGPKAKIDPLRKFASDVVILDTMSSATFAKFWEWVSTTVSRQSKTVGVETGGLPPPPDEVHIAL